jgi:hypothetical protein
MGGFGMFYRPLTPDEMQNMIIIYLRRNGIQEIEDDTNKRRVYVKGKDMIAWVSNAAIESMGVLAIWNVLIGRGIPMVPEGSDYGGQAVKNCTQENYAADQRTDRLLSR